jgi:hypothetical protein
MSLGALNANAVGKIAVDLLYKPQAAHPLGLTKRGVFFQLVCGGVIFLSFETFRGPLTVNLENMSADISTIMQKEAYFSREIIRFRDTDLTIDLRLAQVWEAATAEFDRALPVESRERSIACIINHVMQRENLSHLAQHLPYLSIDELPEAGLANTYWRLVSRVKEIGIAYTRDNNQMTRLAQALGDILGLGPGLTPSGDDFVMGFLLALNRWGKVLFPGLAPAPLNKALQNLADIKTTALSASLIACAVQGQADERLVRAFDGIFLGEPAPESGAN